MVAFQSGKKTKATLPISKHPLFPAMVALWFAALFGLGSLAIRPTLLEKFVLALRLDLVVPAAAPPLGFTSRILLALMMFVIGAAIGFILARRIALSGSERVPLRTARSARAASKDNLADENEDFTRLSAARPAQSSQIPGRRRALAMEEDYVNDYRDHAPLPGHEPQILDLATLGELSESAGPEHAVSAEFATESYPDQISAAEPAFDPWQRHTPEITAAELHDEATPIIAEAPVVAHIGRAFDTPAEPISHAEEVPSAQTVDFHRPAFAAPEVQHQEPAVTQEENEPVAIAQPPRAFDPAPAAEFHQSEVADQTPPTAGLGLMPRDAVEKLTSAPLASLGVVQLAERLALAIARRKTPDETASPLAAPVAFASAQTSTVEPVPAVSVAGPELELPPEPQPEYMSLPEPAAAAPTLPVEPAPEPVRETAIPRAMRPLSFDDDESDEDESLQSILPPRRFAMPAPVQAAITPIQAPHAPEPEPVNANKAEEEDENFASLLGMKPSLRQSFVRVEEPVEPEAPVEPVVIFPGQAPRFASVARPFEAPAQPAPAPVAVVGAEPTPIEAGRRFDAPSAMPASMMAVSPSSGPAIDPEETERALKAALATLQRMSGAA